MENFREIFKNERVNHRKSITRQQVTQEIIEYIAAYSYYNRQRKQKGADYLPPAELTQQYYWQSNLMNTIFYSKYHDILYRINPILRTIMLYRI
ncbi:IS3 family transposase [Nitrosomonas cryotolerans]|uniref:IS3 family transposase n=1 Tax=Nitrosomonas cryotolerans TaxID=44575 RepID=UPI0015A5980B